MWFRLKRYVGFIAGTVGLIVLIGLTLAACGGAVGEVAEEEQGRQPLRVALVVPSAPNDLAFSQSMVVALRNIQGELGGPEGMQLAISDSLFVVEDAAAAIRDYASQGYDLVIAHGSQYGGSVENIAPDFPETSFAWGTTGTTFALDNVFGYDAAAHEGGFVNGALAGLLTESDVIGVVGPIEGADAKAYIDGFVTGVESTNPDATVNVNYIGSFSDVALASEAAQGHIAAGADILTGSAQMVVGAIGVAEENGVLWFGTQVNQAELAPDIVVASQVYHWEVILRDIIANVRDGKLGDEIYAITLANGGQEIEFNQGYKLPGETQEQLREIIGGVIDGEITIELPE